MCFIPIFGPLDENEVVGCPVLSTDSYCGQCRSTAGRAETGGWESNVIQTRQPLPRAHLMPEPYQNHIICASLQPRQSSPGVSRSEEHRHISVHMRLRPVWECRWPRSAHLKCPVVLQQQVDQEDLKLGRRKESPGTHMSAVSKS